MEKKDIVEEPSSEETGELCDTIFYQGNGNSQTHILKYVGEQHLTATTGEEMWSVGRNNLSPLNVIYSPHIGPEIADVNLNPFPGYLVKSR